MVNNMNFDDGILSPTNVETTAEVTAIQDSSNKNGENFWTPILVLYGVTSKKTTNVMSFFLGDDFNTPEEAISYGLNTIKMLGIKYNKEYEPEDELEKDEFVVFKYNSVLNSHTFEIVKVSHQIDAKLSKRNICGKKTLDCNLFNVHKTIQ